MLSPQQRQAKLESLLSRVQRNRSRVGTSRHVPSAAAIPAAAPVVEAAAPEDDDIDFGFHENFEERASMEPAPTPVQTTPVSIADALDSYTPAPVPKEAADAGTPSVAEALRDSLMDIAAEEDATGAVPLVAKKFSSAPTASGPIVDTVGNLKADWTLQAVLDRAWKFGAK